MNNYKKYLKYKYKYYALKKQIGGDKVVITSLTDYHPPTAIKTAYDTYRNIMTNEFMTECANHLPDVCYALTENKISQCVDKLKEGMPEIKAQFDCNTNHKTDTSTCITNKLDSLQIRLNTDALNKLGINKDGTFTRPNSTRVLSSVENTQEPDTCKKLRQLSKPLENSILGYRTYIKGNYNYNPYLIDDILPNLMVDKNFKITLPNSSNELTNELAKSHIDTILSDKHIGFIIETNGALVNKDIKPPENLPIGQDRIIYIKIKNKYINRKYIILNTNQHFNDLLKRILMEHLNLK